VLPTAPADVANRGIPSIFAPVTCVGRQLP
jgi:hypothetical protein